MSLHSLGLSLSVLAALAGCASVPAPTEQMAVSVAAVDNARSAGSNEMAAAEFALARDKLVRAQAAMKAEEYTLAKDLAEQSQVDAQLAVAKSRRMKSEKSAEALKADSQILREELNRKTN